MNWRGMWKGRGGGRRMHAGHFVAPNFVLDLEPGFVAAARLNPSKRVVQSVGARGLPEGALAPSPNKANVADREALLRTIDEVCERVGHAGGRVGLLIPDVAVRVALLQLETLPDDPRDAETMVLWKMREYLPYTSEEARLSYQVVGKQPGALEILGVAARGSVLAEYESTLERVNGGPALVLPSTAALLPLLPQDAEGQLLLHLSPGALTAVVIASDRLRYWRTRPLEGSIENVAEEVSREAARVLATCQDNLSVHVQNVWYCERSLAETKSKIGAAVEGALGRELSPLPGNLLPASGLPAGQRETFDLVGMPFAGLMANLS